MDYCERCRRHLNGALTCAGCGRAAEELRRDARPAQGPAPVAPPELYGGDTAEPYGDDTSEPGTPYAPYDSVPGWNADAPEQVPPGHGRGLGHGRVAGSDDLLYGPDGSEDAPKGPDTAPDIAAGGGARAHRRAGRRPRSAPRRARSKRGRRVLVGVFGVVLAAGALSLAQLALDPGGATGPAAGVTDRSTGLDYDGDPSASGRPAVPGSQVADSGAADAGRTGAASGATSGAGPSATGDARKPGPGGSADASAANASPGNGSGDKGEDGGAAGGTGGGAAGSTGGTAGGTGGASAPAATAPADPPPVGTPSAPPPGHDPGGDHCRRVLLWCV